MEKLRLGIIGAGWIAEKMAITIAQMEQVEAYAIASRDISKAEKFATQWNFTRAFGSYEEMLNDKLVDLVYIATPHSHHYEHARMCILAGKPVLCEKAFTATAPQAEEIINLSREKGVFIAEAIWTRYMPISQTINEILKSGVIGEPKMLSVNLGYANGHKERMKRAELAGGALLDLGVYAINFVFMTFGTDIKEVVSTCVKTDTGMDAQESMTFVYNDGRMAVLHSTMLAKTDRQGIISGSKGHLIVDNCNHPLRVQVVDIDYQVVAQYDAPKHITGYEYEIYACIEALKNEWIESPYMPHAETLRVMRLMDSLRKEWKVKYPWDNW